MASHKKLSPKQKRDALRVYRAIPMKSLKRDLRVLRAFSLQMFFAIISVPKKRTPKQLHEFRDYLAKIFPHYDYGMDLYVSTLKKGLKEGIITRDELKALVYVIDRITDIIYSSNTDENKKQCLLDASEHKYCAFFKNI